MSPDCPRGETVSSSDTARPSSQRAFLCQLRFWKVFKGFGIALAGPCLSTLPAGGLVFPGRAGRRLHRDYKLPRRLREDLKRAGVETPEGFRAHDLRHTFATLATEAGVAPDAIRLTLGHAGGVTASYQHISLAAHRRELSKLTLFSVKGGADAHITKKPQSAATL